MNVVAFSYSIGSFGKPVAMDLAQTAGLTLVPFSEIYRQGLDQSPYFRTRQQDNAEGRGDIDIWEGHFFSRPASTSLFESIVMEKAAKGKVILVGLGAQAVLRDFPGVLRVHVDAPLELRIKRFMELNQITVQEANQTVKWWDLRQRSLFEYGAAFNMAENRHDLSINTENITIPSASRLIAEALRNLPGPADPKLWRANLQRLAMAKKVECAVREAGSALGLAPLEVRPVEETENTLRLTGFVHTQADLDQAARLAEAAAEGWPVQVHLKLLRLHNDLVPPQRW